MNIATENELYEAVLALKQQSKKKEKKQIKQSKPKVFAPAKEESDSDEEIPESTEFQTLDEFKSQLDKIDDVVQPISVTIEKKLSDGQTKSVGIEGNCYIA